MSRTTLYRYFDRRGRLLYVGITGNGLSRMAGHSSSSPWWRLVFDATFEHYRTREAALAAETEAIQVEKPMFNRAQNIRGTRHLEHVMAAMDKIPEGQELVASDGLANALGIRPAALRRACKAGWFRYHAYSTRTYGFKVEGLRSDVTSFVLANVAPSFEYPIAPPPLGPYAREGAT